MSVSFDLLQTKLFSTHSNDDYDRLPIDSTIYLYSYAKVSDLEWQKLYEDLNYYKSNEMIVHKKSIQNIRLHKL